MTGVMLACEQVHGLKYQMVTGFTLWFGVKNLE